MLDDFINLVLFSIFDVKMFWFFGEIFNNMKATLPKALQAFIENRNHPFPLDSY